MRSISIISSQLIGTIQSRQEKNNLSKNISYQKNITSEKKVIRTPLSQRFPIPEDEVTDDPILAISSLNKSERSLLNELIRLKKKHDVVAPSQEWLARKLNVSRQTINHSMKKLVSLRFIYKGYRHMRTCFYNISPFLQQDDIAMKLRHLLPVFKCMFLFSLSLLAGITSALSNDFTLDRIRRNNKNIITYFSTRSTRGSMNATHTVLLDLSKKLKLTRWGQIRLSAFPEHILKEVMEEYEFSLKHQRKSIEMPFHWVYKKCLLECTRNNITPDWALMYELEKSNGMPANPKFIQDVEEKKEEGYKNTEKGSMRIPAYKQSTFSSKQAKPLEVSATKLYPEWKPEPIKKESLETKKQNVIEWLKTPEAENFAKFLGKEHFEKFVANRLLGEAE